jgi:hypothetical protein
LTKLKELELFNTTVSDKGVKKLKEALPNCVITHGTRGREHEAQLGDEKDARNRPISTPVGL